MIRSIQWIAWAPAAALVLPPRIVLAATAAPPEFVEIRLSESVDEPELVQPWTERGVETGLAKAKIDPAAVESRRLVIEVGGTTGAYQLTVGVMEDDEWLGALRQSRCKCTDQQLIDRVSEDVAAMAPGLVPSSKPRPPAARPPRRSQQPENDEPKPARPLWGAGIGVGVVALAALGTGIGLAARGRADSSSSDEAAQGRDTRKPGIGLAVTGGVLLIPALTLVALGVARARQQRVAATPTAGRGFLGVAISGKF